MIRDIRFLPLVAAAAAALAVLKLVGLLSGDPSGLSGTRIATAQQADPAPTNDQMADQAAEQMSDPATAGMEIDETVTVDTDPAAVENGGLAEPEVRFVDDLRPDDGAEAALLERLGERRLQLEERERELDLRENLLRAAEERIEERLSELRAIEERLSTVEAAREEAVDERLANLITMYETMKPKDAAEVFNRLDLPVLVEVASRIKARTMAEILAAMSPDRAEALTVALASFAQQAPKVEDALPQIIGTEPNS